MRGNSETFAWMALDGGGNAGNKDSARKDEVGRTVRDRVKINESGFARR
ncbi:MACPF domain-containing protein NSL1 [Senna tora]|uniref:MACPF domain-containing protein NSL1 n=1 Tax=Senna tora TaxID=362788 RepID=A0A834X8U8_9FABA|nr:MACPF domain-containing protein NSL1 [Senna tora]